MTNPLSYSQAPVSNSPPQGPLCRTCPELARSDLKSHRLTPVAIPFLLLPTVFDARFGIIGTCQCYEVCVVQLLKGADSHSFSFWLRLPSERCLMKSMSTVMVSYVVVRR